MGLIDGSRCDVCIGSDGSEVKDLESYEDRDYLYLSCPAR